MSSRTRAFAVFAVVCVAAAIAAAAAAIVGTDKHRAAVSHSVASARSGVERLLAGGTPFVVFRDVDRSRPSTYGTLSIAAVKDGRAGTRLPAGASCSRLAYAAGHGICLDTESTHMVASLLDDRLHTTHRLSLAGIPSRARVSPDGRWGGVTSFVVGHAYAAPGQFSTVATVIDLRTGKALGDLEHDFKVYVGDKLLDARDRNFWGLTFAGDGDTFYATAAAGDDTWLVKGSIKARTAKAIHDNVECPSLSPDGTRIAYKKLVGRNPTKWRFHVLDLATGAETPLAETRSIDDQLAWLDDDHVLYADTKQVTWAVPADGTGAPARWMDGADSATVASAGASASAPADPPR